MIASSGYYVDLNQEPSYLFLHPGISVIPGRAFRGIEVEFKAGYGTDGSAVPEALKSAIKEQALEMFDTRSMATELSDKIRLLLRPFKVMRA